MDDQSKEYQAPVENTPAIGITLQYPLDDGLGRSLVFQTFVAADCSTGQINGALDKVRIAADRQRAIAMLPTLKGQLSDWEDKLKLAAEQHLMSSSELDLLNNEASKAQAASGRRNPQVPSNQAAARARAEQGMSSAKQAILQIQKEIVVAKRKIADAEALISIGS